MRITAEKRGKGWSPARSSSRTSGAMIATGMAGVTVEGQYWTMGHCDGVLILTADHEKKILHLLAELAAGGNVRTDTMRAFTDKEFAHLLK